MQMRRRSTMALFTGLLLWFGGTAALAQETLKNEREVKAFTDRVMTAVAGGDLAAAYAEMKRYSTLPAAEVDVGMNASIAQRNNVFVARYGKVVGHDFIHQKKLGKSLMRLSYIEQREKQPLVWVFNFYSTGSAWALNQFRWDDHTAALYAGQ
jgi:hypothetical protein